MDEKVSIWSGIVLMFLVNALKGLELTQCRNFGENCIRVNQRPCCDENLKCKWSYSANGYQCMKEAKLGDSCRSNDDCGLTLHSKCSSIGKCICRQNYVQMNNTSCAPLLNEFCWIQSCVPKNSTCIDHECKCNSGFLAQSNDLCLPILHELPCESDAICESIAFAKCSFNKTCVCSENTIATSPIFCSLLLGEFCRVDHECGITNSECVDNKCQCKLPYISESNTECKLPYLGMSCDNGTYCETRIENTICIDHVCKCSLSFAPRDNHTCLSNPYEKCDNDDGCSKTNSACVDNRCQCKPEYVLQKKKCLPRYLGGSCQETSDCFNLQFANCLKGECICNSGFIPSNQTACIKSLDMNCSADTECLIKNSHCNRDRCECRHGYIQELRTKCLTMILQGFCIDQTDCKFIPNTRCSRRNKCICKKNYIEINEMTCASLLDGNCSKDSECAVENSVCIDNKCRCDSRYFYRFHNQCEHLFLEKFCSLDTDCIDIPYATCSNNKCICRSNYTQLGLSVCAPLLGSYCGRDEECVMENSLCVANECQCKSSYTAIRPYKCGRISLGQSCETDINCKLIHNAVCSPNKICVCNPNTFALNEMTCTPFLNNFCQFDECKIESSHCVEHKCQCKPGYSATSVNQCSSTQSLYSCSDVSDCVEPWHFVCSEEKKCVCKSNNIAVTNSTCLPILGGICWREDQCTIENSVCDDFHCQCRPGFEIVANNMCIQPLQ